MCLPGNLAAKTVKPEETEGKTTKTKAPLVVPSFCLQEESEHLTLVETSPPGSRSVSPVGHAGSCSWESWKTSQDITGTHFPPATSGIAFDYLT